MILFICQTAYFPLPPQSHSLLHMPYMETVGVRGRMIFTRFQLSACRVKLVLSSAADYLILPGEDFEVNEILWHRVPLVAVENL